MSRTHLACVLLGLLACNAQADTTPPAPDALQPLLSTMDQRLYLSELVALTKWDSGKPIQDNAREAQVVANAKVEAAKRKLDPDDVADLMSAQIEASKLVQYGRLAQWQAAHRAPDTPRPDLNKEIRPKLDKLQDQLLKQYAAFLPYRKDPNCPQWLAKERSALIKDYLHGQAMIRATGELCIVGN
ncbi:chorismate mutase [Pseudomonas vancouverensis]|uniref:Chorismate mutase n=1 Tax=Pseudomonas vancouverensis TaxID=95300 RepID=A0A1H2NVS4_PSEVA|nr:chorismate mutase [Pseudomonas vancouverensis]KAB0496308.1 chorismate mutase [Pseudomonas vancouverensis]TDB64984.1 chorismate mutase [Pseudomonas vancouverensis]SDV08906.1 chorismate mutase [Pseudomonas vancouverensis]